MKECNIKMFMESIRYTKDDLSDVFKNYSFFNLYDGISNDQQVFKYLHESEVILIDQNSHSNPRDDLCFFVSFEKTMVLFNQKTIELFFKSIEEREKTNICFLNNTKTIFDDLSNINYNEIKSNSYFLDEIAEMKNNLIIKSNNSFFKTIYNPVINCIFGYLLQKSYFKSQKKFNRIKNLKVNKKSSETKSFKEEEYIELRNLGIGSIFKALLIYHIKKEKFFVIKRVNAESKETQKLIEREKEIYNNLNHPLMPKFIGLTEKKEIIIEFINGRVLDNISSLSYKDKVQIIFQLLLILHYFHYNNYIYRDLSPYNVMINDNMIITVIDFDRMINTESHTIDFGSVFRAPEIENGLVSDKSDVYSLGKMIIYLITGSTDIEIRQIDESGEYSLLDRISEMCLSTNPQLRDSINDLMFEFFSNDDLLIHVKYLIYDYKELSFELYDPESSINILFEIFDIFDNHINISHVLPGLCTHNILRTILFYTNLDEYLKYAHFILGFLYYMNQYIDKAIHHITIAANQNVADAQYALGNIYINRRIMFPDVYKAIHYFTLAANQNHANAQNNLGLIYISKEFIQQDIKKSIFYFTLAANQNHLDANFNLGVIYDEGIYVKRDINKAIYYYKVAADQKHSEARYKLAALYEKYNTHAHLKEIEYYYTASANQDNPDGLFALSNTYLFKEYSLHYISPFFEYLMNLIPNNKIPNNKIQEKLTITNSEIQRGICYMILASDKGCKEAHFKVGFIFHEGRLIERDIKKAIKYYKDAMNIRDNFAKNNIAVIYKNGIGNEIEPILGSAIEYFKEAIKYDNILSKYNLAHLYIYNNFDQKSIDESIKLLIESSNQGFEPSKELLSLILIKKFNFDLRKVEEFLSNEKNGTKIISKSIIELIQKLNLNKKTFKKRYNYYKKIDFIYDLYLRPIQSKNILNNKKTDITNTKLTDINKEFYEGFGC